jgi:hypothetical protein
MHIHPKTGESLLIKADSNLLAKIDDVKDSKKEIFSSKSFPYLCDYYGWHSKLIPLKMEFFLDNDNGHIQDFKYFRNPYEYKKRENYQEFKKTMENFYQKGQTVDTNLYEKAGYTTEKYNNCVTFIKPEPIVDNPFGLFKVTNTELDKLGKKYASQKSLKCQSVNGWMPLEPIDGIDNSELELQKRKNESGLWKPVFNEELDAFIKSKHLQDSKLDQVNMQIEELKYKIYPSMDQELGDQLDSREYEIVQSLHAAQIQDSAININNNNMLVDSRNGNSNDNESHNPRLQGQYMSHQTISQFQQSEPRGESNLIQNHTENVCQKL